MSTVPSIAEFEAWYNAGPRRRCRVTDEYVFFWPGPFSQWARYNIEIDGVSYNTCEQYMMAEKARLFGDKGIEMSIMLADDPSVQKALGRKVKNFQLPTWQEHACEIVYRANRAKFTQHPELRKMLLATGDRLIVEGSAEDPVWGIGLSYMDDRVLDRSNWRGTNWLGEAITRVRDELNTTSKN